MFRSYSDIESGRVHTAPHRSQLEANCNEIFARTPAVTKEMLQKLQNAELGPKRTVVCGYELHTRQISVLLALLFLFVVSCGVAAIFWGTSLYSNFILSKLIISNNSETYERFAHPSPAQVKVYIFNYTNVDEVAQNFNVKFKLQELGPYTYEDTAERVNVEFSDDGNTVRYQESHSYRFLPEASVGRMLNDRVVVPNLPLLSAAAMSKNSFYLTRLGMSSVFTSLNARPFLTLPADRFIFGYDDNLYSLAKSVLALTKPLPFDKFGLLASRNGLSKDVKEIYTGKDDINKLGIVKSVDKVQGFDHWLTEECNKFGGADGPLFPPKSVQNKEPVEYLLKDLGRRVPYVYQKDTKILNDAIPASRYVMPDNVYGHPHINNPSNQCYCDIGGSCPPHGLLNITKSSFGTPVFISNPHFLQADPSLSKTFTGLKPNKEKHTSFIDVHPTMGFSMQGWTRLQTNVQVQKSLGITQLSMFDDDVILPVAWMEFGLDAADQPEEVKQIFFDTTNLVQGVELAFKYGSMLTSLVTFFAMLLVIRGDYCRNINKTPLQRTSTGERRLIS